MVGTPSGVFNAYNALFRSSGLDRTITTARSFIEGAFPPMPSSSSSSSGLPTGEQVIPVYSLGEDPLVRAYTKCPAYSADLQGWYSSEEFLAKEARTASLRATVKAAGPELNTTLANWYNVWDGFSVHRTYRIGAPMPPLDDATFSQVEGLAHWLETTKMRSWVTGNRLGGLLVAELVGRLRAAADGDLAAGPGPGPVYLRLLHVSGHYNTQLGLLAALGADTTPYAADIAWLRKIPETAALMAFELHSTGAKADKKYFVRLVVQDGPKAEYVVVPLPCATEGDEAENAVGTGACTLASFLDTAEPAAINGIHHWCLACKNGADPVCQAAMHAKNAATWQLAVAAILPLSILGVIVGVMAVVRRRRASRSINKDIINAAQMSAGLHQ
jgi:lysosomal acid phosphatase